MSDTNMIHGRSLFASMKSDATAVKEMLQYMGVEPTDEMINDAMTHFALTSGGDITMSGLYDFLKQKTVMSKYNLESIKSVKDTRN